MTRLLLSLCFLATLGMAAHAASTDAILELSKKGATDEQLLKEVDATPGEFTMGATQVIELREAHISDKVIAAMLRHVGTEKKAAAAPAPQAPVAPVQPFAPQAPAPIEANLPPPNPGNPNLPGKLTIDNLDDRTYAYFYEPAVQTLWIAAPNGQAGTVSGHTSTTLSMKAGTYHIRYSGQADEGVTLTVYGGDHSAVSISRVMVENAEILQATAFERGERKATGKIASMAPQASPTYVQRQVVEVPVYTQAPVYYYGAPTYYYGPSYYSRGYNSPYYGGGHYGGGSSLNFNFGFGNSGHYRR